jgi:hypothetical protein
MEARLYAEYEMNHATAKELVRRTAVHANEQTHYQKRRFHNQGG